MKFFFYQANMDLSGSGAVKFTEKYSLPCTQDQSIIFYGDQF
jgi:hypothetical protein